MVLAPFLKEPICIENVNQILISSHQSNIHTKAFTPAKHEHVNHYIHKNPGGGGVKIPTPSFTGIHKIHHFFQDMEHISQSKSIEVYSFPNAEQYIYSSLLLQCKAEFVFTLF